MEDDINTLLEKAKTCLKDEVSKIAYDTWIANLEIISIEDDTITLMATSQFQQEAIQTRYYDLLVNTFNFITNKRYIIKTVVSDNVEHINNNKNSFDISNSDTDDNEDDEGFYDDDITPLNPNYTFDSFVIGNNNSFAQAASFAVAESPGSSYNPLFLYGGVGLGKTHLMHSIGNEILKNDPTKKVLYVTSEKFINEFINAIKDKKNDRFRNKYRNIDVLLIDDIQFIAGKERIQEEFFHTFNSLYEKGGQIIMSSDQPPKDINDLEDRLKSRFEWGLMADISNADYETRLAILRKKVQTDKIIIDDEILSMIATKVDSNIRELEGTLNKIIAKASLTHSPITLEMAEQSIVDVIKQNEKVLSSKTIQDSVAKYFNINSSDLRGSKRSNDVAHPRQIAMYLCRDLLNMQFSKIGTDFGNRDHTTVMHAVCKIQNEMEESESTKLVIDDLRNLILKN